MDKAEYVRHRRAKYMAQTLEALEELVIATMDIPASSTAAYHAQRGLEHEPGAMPGTRAYDRVVTKRRVAFQEHVEPHLTKPVVAAIREFKGLVRARFNALANDATDVMALGDDVVNVAAIEMRDRLSPIGRP